MNSLQRCCCCAGFTSSSTYQSRTRRLLPAPIRIWCTDRLDPGEPQRCTQRHAKARELFCQWKSPQSSADKSWPLLTDMHGDRCLQPRRFTRLYSGHVSTFFNFFNSSPAAVRSVAIVRASVCLSVCSSIQVRINTKLGLMMQQWCRVDEAKGRTRLCRPPPPPLTLPLHLFSPYV